LLKKEKELLLVKILTVNGDLLLMVRCNNMLYRACEDTAPVRVIGSTHGEVQ